MRLSSSVLLAVALALATGCSTRLSGGVSARVENEATGAYAEFRAGVQNPSVPYETGLSDLSLCYEIRFVGSDGAVIQTVGPVQGQSSGQVPPGTVRYEKVVVPCPPDNGENPPDSQAKTPLPDLRVARSVGSREMVLVAPFSVGRDGVFAAAYEGPVAFRYETNENGFRSWNYIVSIRHDGGRAYITVGCSAPTKECSLSINGLSDFPSTPIVWPNGFRSETFSVPMDAFEVPLPGGAPVENALAFSVNGWSGEVVYTLRSDL